MSAGEDNELLNDGSVRRKKSYVDNCIDNPRSKRIFFILLSLAMGNAADAVEIICVGFIMAEMGDISATDKEFLSAAVFMGMLFGGFLCGYASDIVGRRPCLKYSLMLNTIAGFASAAAPDINTLIATRVFGGLGIGGSVPIVFSMGAEIFPSDVRGKYLSLIASFWMVGAIYAGFTAWVMLGNDFNDNKIMPGVGWRWYAVVSALPALTALVLTYRVIPESPRYLLEKKRYDDAAHILNSISTVVVTGALLAELDPAHSPSVDSTGSRIEQGNQRKNASTLKLLFTGKLMPTCCILITIWFMLSFGSYGIATWISVLFTDVGISNAYAASFIFALANLPGNLISVLMIEVYGRRWLLSVGMCLAGLCTIGFAIDTSNALVVVACAALFNCFSVVGWNSLDCLSVECFPTYVRTSAMGVLAASGRLGAISAQFVNGSLESNVPLLLFVTSACSIFGGLIAWLLKSEPAGAALPEDELDELDENGDVGGVDEGAIQAVTGSDGGKHNYNPVQVSDA